MPKIMIVGEAWGEVEERERTAFVGPTGWELNKMLKEAGIHPADTYKTNVFNLRPKNNKIGYLCGPRESSIPGYPALGSTLTSLGPSIPSKGSYIRNEYARELKRLADEIEQVDPNVIIACGNIACWALLGKTSIKYLRGTTWLSTHTITNYKVLPAYHPAAIFRQWSIRPTTIVDLMKAKRESTHPEILRPERTIWIEPSLEDLYEFDKRYIQSCERLAVDIETAGAGITCIGFAPQRDIAIVIPGIGLRRAGGTYWSSMGVERKVWELIKDILSRPIPKTFQNGLFDIAFIWRAWRIPVMNAEDDTMLLHHALQPEALKSLGYLGSLYTDEGAWKQMRERKTTIKRED